MYCVFQLLISTRNRNGGAAAVALPRSAPCNR